MQLIPGRQERRQQALRLILLQGARLQGQGVLVQGEVGAPPHDLPPALDEAVDEGCGGAPGAGIGLHACAERQVSVRLHAKEAP